MHSVKVRSLVSTISLFTHRYYKEDSAREFEGMLIGKNELRHYVGGKEDAVRRE